MKGLHYTLQRRVTTLTKVKLVNRLEIFAKGNKLNTFVEEAASVT